MGHAFDLNNTIKNNLSLRKASHNKFSKVKKAYNKIIVKYPEHKKKEKLSGKDIEQLKRKIRFEIIKEDRISIAITLILSFFILTLSLIYLHNRFDIF